MINEKPKKLHWVGVRLSDRLKKKLDVLSTKFQMSNAEMIRKLIEDKREG
jgi:predicted DNA-binding protein